MYTEFFGLKIKPFTITPDPRFLYMSQVHKEALAHLVYGVREKSGFVVITGDVGTGKTTLLNALLQKLPPGMPKVVIKNPNVKQENIYFLLGEAIGLPDENRARDYLNLYENRLKEIGGAALIVDEAQGLSIEMLEEIRLLSNLETPNEKLVHIILLGQPELNATLRSPNLRQLKQRISVKFTISPLSQAETIEYIKHRLRVAGYEPMEKPIFSPAAMQVIYQRTRGYPRVINILCDNAMLAAYTEDTREVTPRIIKQVASEIEGTYAQGPRVPLPRTGIIAAAVIALAAGAALWYGLARDADGPADKPALERPAQNQPAPQASRTVPVPVIPTGPEATPARKMAAQDVPTAMTDITPPVAASLPPSLSQIKPQGGYVKAREGDSLASLAIRHYGRIDGDILKSVRDANANVGNLERLSKGQSIFLPNIAKGEIFSVGIAWYHSETEATAVKADLKAVGYDPSVFPLVDPQKRLWYMVSLGRFATREEAVKYALELSGKGFLYAKPIKISMES
ncbi:MAG TPA: AAA family ATPase [Deltaproteobacteria bacterium]|nr:AAA family ATPase [Deltaproteobacteria bacterium]